MLAGSLPSAAAPRTFSIDGAASTATAHVGKTGIGSFAGHEHNVATKGLQGEVMLDAANLPASAGGFVGPARAFAVRAGGGAQGGGAKVEKRILGPPRLGVGPVS